MEKQMKLSSELNIEITALANKTQCHPNIILNAILNCGHENIRIQAYKLRENYDLMRPEVILKPSKKKILQEPRPEHWRQALRIEPIPFSPPNANRPISDMMRVEHSENMPVTEFQSWEFSKDRPTWIKNDDIGSDASHWYLINKAINFENGEMDHESLAIEIKPNALSLVNFLAFIPNWVDKAKILEALTPALISVSLGAEFKSEKITPFQEAESDDTPN